MLDGYGEIVVLDFDFFWLSLFSLRKVFDSDELIKSTFIRTTFLTWSLRKLLDEGGSNAS